MDDSDVFSSLHRYFLPKHGRQGCVRRVPANKKFEIWVEPFFPVFGRKTSLRYMLSCSSQFIIFGALEDVAPFLGKCRLLRPRCSHHASSGLMRQSAVGSSVFFAFVRATSSRHHKLHPHVRTLSTAFRFSWAQFLIRRFLLSGLD